MEIKHYNFSATENYLITKSSLSELREELNLAVLGLRFATIESVRLKVIARSIVISGKILELLDTIKEGETQCTPENSCSRPGCLLLLLNEFGEVEKRDLLFAWINTQYFKLSTSNNNGRLTVLDRELIWVDTVHCVELLNLHLSIGEVKRIVLIAVGSCRPCAACGVESVSCVPFTLNVAFKPLNVRIRDDFKWFVGITFSARCECKKKRETEN